MKFIKYGDCPICGNIGKLVQTESTHPQTGCEECVENSLEELNKSLKMRMVEPIELVKERFVKGGSTK